MEDWLKKLWMEFKHSKTGLVILFLIILSSGLNLVALVSDIGFSEEIKQYRLLILEIALGAGVVFILITYHIRIFQERNKFKDQVDELQRKLVDLEQEKESAFRLMERYKGEAQEDIFNRLNQLVIFSLKQHEWQNKGARVERFRIEEFILDNKLDVELLIAERVTVIISIGTQDGVLKGMRFIVQDPTDLRRYGVIEVKETAPSGAVCAIVGMDHQAFWYEVLQTIEAKEGKAKILNALANTIVPHSALKNMNPDNARELFEWLQTIKGTEL